MTDTDKLAEALNDAPVWLEDGLEDNMRELAAWLATEDGINALATVPAIAAGMAAAALKRALASTEKLPVVLSQDEIEQILRDYGWTYMGPSTRETRDGLVSARLWKSPYWPGDGWDAERETTDGT